MLFRSGSRGVGVLKMENENGRNSVVEKLGETFTEIIEQVQIIKSASYLNTDQALMVVACGLLSQTMWALEEIKDELEDLIFKIDGSGKF